MSDNDSDNNNNNNENNATLSHNQSTTRIDIYLIGHQGFVWNAQDVETLRFKHRIIGCLIGCVASSNVLGGTLPMMLSYEETRLGMEKGWIRLLDQGTMSAPMQAELDQLVLSKQLDSAKQVEELIEKKRQRDQQYREQQQQQQQQGDVDDGVDVKERKQKKQRQDSGSATPNGVVAKQNYEAMVHTTLFTSVADLLKDSTRETYLACHSNWRQQHAAEIKEVCDIKRLMMYDQESNNKSIDHDLELRYRVFKDLWEKGYYLTNGTKFGGTFLAYIGDPLHHHSEMIVIVKRPTQQVSSLELISMARLAVNVNKTTLLATTTIVDKDDGDDHHQNVSNINDNGSNNNNRSLIYLTIQWEGVT
ncbi:hypothetical protein SAMD00019534_069080 [Acytostelium subglobosum LB1]|uniref:hypothetical protein n=1 Tax=Acytostelium subglobosum LB1 TaxID=1410327 RepID=UPI000644E7D1|nr:hypothetical protein SAMD00019534_069080 [Acytostelium subglobosum LB1]GAM23733.1 hypothetical protein SAMD00019534_069080 [Acytostelium subglobosum LB1]|eukprot:XP_012753474.1 hypothetical protein SAMD00019534_069080 [Acytostelium subglobosum LB1]